MRIPRTELIGVTVLLVTCSYRGKEFTRVGYYVNNDYGNLELLVLTFSFRCSFDFLVTAP